MTTLELRLLAYAVLAMLLFGGTFSYGLRVGEHRVQVGWDADKARWAAHDAQVAETAARAASDALNREAAAQAHNDEVIHGLQSTLGDAQARGDDFARRLRVAETAAAARGRDVPQAAGQPAAPAAGGAGSSAALDAALADAAAECIRNADRLDALVGEIKPQL